MDLGRLQVVMWLREIWLDTVLCEVKTFILEKGFGFIESALPSQGGVRSLNCCNTWAIARNCEGCSQCLVTLECCFLPGDVFFSKTELSSDLQSVPASVALFLVVAKKGLQLISIRSQWILMHFKKTKESETDLKGKPVQFEVTMGKAQLRDTWVKHLAEGFFVGRKTRCDLFLVRYIYINIDIQYTAYIYVYMYI